MAAKKKADTASADSTSKVQTTSTGTVYLAPGEVPDSTRPDAYLDPKLAETREAEIKKNDVVIETAPREPSIDPALVKARDEQIKRETDRARKS